LLLSLKTFKILSLYCRSFFLSFSFWKTWQICWYFFSCGRDKLDAKVTLSKSLNGILRRIPSFLNRLFLHLLKGKFFTILLYICLIRKLYDLKFHQKFDIYLPRWCLSDKRMLFSNMCVCGNGWCINSLMSSLSMHKYLPATKLNSIYLSSSIYSFD
jgi:hypothetical protein